VGIFVGHNHETEQVPTDLSKEESKQWTEAKLTKQNLGELLPPLLVTIGVCYLTLNHPNHQNSSYAFKGKSDPKAYLEWERKEEMIFDIHRFLSGT
jgi:hypothetical protein